MTSCQDRWQADPSKAGLSPEYSARWCRRRRCVPARHDVTAGRAQAAGRPVPANGFPRAPVTATGALFWLLMTPVAMRSTRGILNTNLPGAATPGWSAQRSTEKHSTEQRSTEQHSTAQRKAARSTDVGPQAEVAAHASVWTRPPGMELSGSSPGRSAPLPRRTLPCSQLAPLNPRPRRLLTRLLVSAERLPKQQRRTRHRHSQSALTAESGS